LLAATGAVTVVHRGASAGGHQGWSFPLPRGRASTGV